MQNKNRALHPHFLRILNLSEIDPLLIQYGIDLYAEQIDSIDQQSFQNDSLLKELKINKEKLSIEVLKNQFVTEKLKEQSTSKKKYFYLLVGLLIGLFSSFLFRKKKKTSIDS